MLACHDLSEFFIGKLSLRQASVSLSKYYPMLIQHRCRSQATNLKSYNKATCRSIKGNKKKKKEKKTTCKP